MLESTQKKKTLTRRATLTLERRRRVSSIPSSTHKRVYLLIYFVFFTFTYSPFCSIHCNRVSTARAFFFFARLAPSLHPSFHSFVCSFFFFKKKKQQKKERSRALFELLQFFFFCSLFTFSLPNHRFLFFFLFLSALTSLLSSLQHCSRLVFLPLLFLTVFAF